MKLKISDMMDHVECTPIEIREKDIASAEWIKEAAMKKIHGTTTKTRVARKIPKAGIIAAVVAATLCLTAASAAVIKWGGFAFTAGMSEAEKNELIEEATTLGYGAYAYEDQNGYMHYLDENGNEVLVLSAEEAAKYELEKQAEKEQAVRESTTLVDASTLPLMPHAIIELAVDDEGQFAECALGNGNMILLHPAGKNGFDLKVGDVVTIELTANDKCILEFGRFKDGIFVDGESVNTKRHSYTFEVEEAGLYCFSVKYYSTDASIFTNCTVTVE